MAEQKGNDCEMNGEDFSQDVSANDHQSMQEENGGAGTNGLGQENSSGRDDDRYFLF